eukprot:g15015.t1
MVKTHQWVTLTREDAVRFGKYAIRALNFWIENSLRTPFAGVWGTGATDEGTPAAALVVSLTADAAVVAKNGPFADREKTALHYLMEHVGGGVALCDLHSVDEVLREFHWDPGRGGHAEFAAARLPRRRLEKP